MVQNEIQPQKGIKLNKKEINKLELKEKNELIENDYYYYYKAKKEIFYSYIFSFVNIIYIYLFNIRKKKNTTSKDEIEEIKMNLNTNGFFEDKNKLRKDLIMIFFNLIIPNNNMIKYKTSEIILKIQGTGYQNILSSFFSTSSYPNNIYINGIEKNSINYNYYFDEINNTVKLVWDEPIDNCNSMFKECLNIIEIDLSKFDTSNVIDMGWMFESCSLLSSLDVSNFNTSKVISMGGCLQNVHN